MYLQLNCFSASNIFNNLICRIQNINITQLNKQGMQQQLHGLSPLLLLKLKVLLLQFEV